MVLQLALALANLILHFVNRGSFQPRRSQSRCLKCPIGFVCPDFGMSKPDLLAGFVCQSLGLREAKIRCPAGHYCLAGTKTDDPTDFAEPSSAQYVVVQHNR